MSALPVPQFPLEKSQDKIRASPWRWGEESRDSPTPLPPWPFNYRFPETPKPEKTPSCGPKPGFYGDHRGGRWGKGSRGTNGCPVPNSVEKTLPVGQRPEDFLCFLLQIPAFFSPQDHLHASSLHPEKRQGRGCSRGGVTNPKDAPTTETPMQPPLHRASPSATPKSAPLSILGGKNQRFWLPPSHPRWGAAGGEGSGRAAPGPRSHDLSGPERCYI